MTIITRRRAKGRVRPFIGAVLAAALTLGVTLAGPAPEAQAAGAELTKTLWLSGSPTRNMQPACIGRSIYLASGTYRWVAKPPSNPWNGWYDWGNYANHERTNPAERQIWLASGNYYWSYCLIPRNGSYILESMLSKPGSLAAVLTASQSLTGLPDKYRNWGGWLTRLST